jgi:carboxypeptidase C (cathepsin A)
MVTGGHMAPYTHPEAIAEAVQSVSSAIEASNSRGVSAHR